MAFVLPTALRKPSYILAIVLLVLAAWGLMSYKLFVLDYPMAGLIPTTAYQVDLNMEATGHGDDIRMRTYLPRTDQRQFIRDEESAAGNFNFTIENNALNRIGTWTADAVEGRHAVRYSYSVEGKHVRYTIPADMNIPWSYPDDIKPYLQEEEGIQVSDPLIQQTIDKLFPNGTYGLLHALTTIHRHLQDNFENRNFSGFTDALTALKLGEASCNGKSRLFLALARKINIPTRLVGGVILEQSSKRTSHQWVEAYIAGHWVPFDTINDYFAEIPAHYLALYYGDLALFKHTANVNFNYSFTIVKRLVPQREALRWQRFQYI